MYRNYDRPRMARLQHEPSPEHTRRDEQHEGYIETTVTGLSRSASAVSCPPTTPRPALPPAHLENLEPPHGAENGYTGSTLWRNQTQCMHCSSTYDNSQYGIPSAHLEEQNFFMCRSRLGFAATPLPQYHQEKKNSVSATTTAVSATTTTTSTSASRPKRPKYPDLKARAAHWGSQAWPAILWAGSASIIMAAILITVHNFGPVAGTLWVLGTELAIVTTLLLSGIIVFLTANKAQAGVVYGAFSFWSVVWVFCLCLQYRYLRLRQLHDREAREAGDSPGEVQYDPRDLAVLDSTCFTLGSVLGVLMQLIYAKVTDVDLSEGMWKKLEKAGDEKKAAAVDEVKAAMAGVV